MQMKTQKLTAMSILLALVIILQLFATFIPMKPFNLNLTLIPIVVGAALYGKKSGALLGFAFAAVVMITYITGAAAFGHILWLALPIMIAIVTLFRGAATGFAAGAVYNLLKSKSSYFAGVASAVIAPIVNTGIYCLAMIFLFRDALSEKAGGTDIYYFLIFGMVGINFLIELAINVLLSPAIVRIIGVRKKNN